MVMGCLCMHCVGRVRQACLCAARCVVGSCNQHRHAMLITRFIGGVLGRCWECAGTEIGEETHVSVRPPPRRSLLAPRTSPRASPKVGAHLHLTSQRCALAARGSHACAPGLGPTLYLPHSPR